MIPSELRRRLAAYELRGADPAKAERQALAPHVLAVNKRYYLLVSWFTPGSSSRVLYGRTAEGASPLSAYVDREGWRMDLTHSENISGSMYDVKQGVRYSGTLLNVEDWIPAGGRRFSHLILSARCGPTHKLGDATFHTSEQQKAALRELGQRFIEPLVQEPLCATAPHANMTASEHALAEVTSERECLQYCAATSACKFFSYVASGTEHPTWRKWGGSCWLYSDADVHDNRTIERADMLVWGAKPPVLQAHVPGGSLILDAAALSTRGSARGPSSIGALAYMVRPLQLGVPGEPEVPIRIVLTFAFASCMERANHPSSNGSTDSSSSCDKATMLGQQQLGAR